LAKSLKITIYAVRLRILGFGNIGFGIQGFGKLYVQERVQFGKLVLRKTTPGKIFRGPDNDHTVT
jgi:hypothetical protein